MRIPLVLTADLYSSEKVLVALIMASSGKITILSETFQATSTQMRDPDPMVLGEPHASALNPLEANVGALHSETIRFVHAINDIRKSMLEQGDLVLTTMDYQQGEIYCNHAVVNPSRCLDKVREALLALDVDRNRINAELTRKAGNQQTEIDRMLAMTSEEREKAYRRVRADGIRGFHKALAIQDSIEQGHDPVTSETSIKFRREVLTDYADLRGRTMRRSNSPREPHPKRRASKRPGNPPHVRETLELTGIRLTQNADSQAASSGSQQPRASSTMSTESRKQSIKEKVMARRQASTDRASAKSSATPPESQRIQRGRSASVSDPPTPSRPSSNSSELGGSVYSAYSRATNLTKAEHDDLTEEQRRELAEGAQRDLIQMRRGRGLIDRGEARPLRKRDVLDDARELLQNERRRVRSLSRTHSQRTSRVPSPTGSPADSDEEARNKDPFRNMSTSLTQDEFRTQVQLGRRGALTDVDLLKGKMYMDSYSRRVG